jgi:hypothetical protein
MELFRKKCPLCNACTEQIDENHYKKYCNARRGSIDGYSWCPIFMKLEQLREEQNKRTPKEWIENPEIKSITLPKQKSEESQPNKKQAKDWFNPSKR